MRCASRRGSVASLNMEQEDEMDRTKIISRRVERWFVMLVIILAAAPLLGVVLGMLVVVLHR